MIELINFKESRKIMSNTNIIIYACVRDIEDIFIETFSNIDILCSYFNKVNIIILENNSKDNSRNLLKNWSKNKVKNVERNLILYDDLDKYYSSKCVRLSFCRNKILEYIFTNNLENEYKYAIHYEISNSYLSIDFESICNCFQYDLNAWDMMTCVEKNKKIDFETLRYNDLFDVNIKSCKFDALKYDENKKKFQKLIEKENIINVNSSFNGLAIYKLKSIKTCKYSGEYTCDKCNNLCCKECNSHIGFHYNMIKNGCKLYINTKMIINIKSENSTISYNDFVLNIKDSIPNINRDPICYFLENRNNYMNGLWLDFGTDFGEYINLLSNYNSSLVYTFNFIKNNYNWNNNNDNNEIDKFPFLNKNVEKISVNSSHSLKEFKKKNLINNIISFIHINYYLYQDVKKILENFHDKIGNNSIIIFDKIVNYNGFYIHALKSFYEFTQKYNITFEWIGINGEILIENINNINTKNLKVCVKIIDNPFLNINKEDIQIEENSNLEDDNIIVKAFEMEEKFKEIENIKIEVVKEVKCEANEELDYKQFQWEIYINNYNDLKHISCKKDAWTHWIHHGKKEGRKCNLNEMEILKKINEDFFIWCDYVNLYDDLKYITCKEDAWEHWINYGKKEGRICNKEKELFDWKYYVYANRDLTILDEEDAWKHWINSGKKEERKMNDFNWIDYLSLNLDLVENKINTKEKAINHWIFCGKCENRKYKE